MLETLLDTLGIPQRRGLIDPQYDLQPPQRESLAEAVGKLLETYPEQDVEVYLGSLVAMDSDTWGGLGRVIPAR